MSPLLEYFSLNYNYNILLITMYLIYKLLKFEKEIMNIVVRNKKGS